MAHGIEELRLSANGLSHRAYAAGEGPLVLFCHGWPETALAWRHQIASVAALGYRAVAVDMRGYGGTDAPAAIEAYSILDLVADQVAIVAALGSDKAVIIGHDWGAPVAWHAALMRPDRFHAVCGMSVPWAPNGRHDLLASLKAQGIHDFYIQHFQAPGVAEVELERDVATTLKRVYVTGSGLNRDRTKGFTRLGTGGFLDNTIDPDHLPGWLADGHFDHLVEAFAASGFRGGLNWYRNVTRNWRLTSVWRGEPIRVPALFIVGEKDGVMRFPASKAQIEAYPRTLPDCRGVHVIPGVGHWVQQEAAEEVSRLLAGFLAEVSPRG